MLIQSSTAILDRSGIGGKKMPTIAALVPMRHHSERVPEKNFRPLAGKPLYHHILHTLVACPEISVIAVDTDSPVIAEGLQADFPFVQVIDRPADLRADTVPMNDILLYDTGLVDADFYLQTHSTNPLLRPETVSRAIAEFLKNFPEHDSLFSVTRLQTRLYDSGGKPINHDPSVLLRTQDLPPIYEENSCLYLFTRDMLAIRHNRLGENPLLYEMDADEAWDIDDELDFAITDFLMGRQK
jgi:CMP-N-acetylneuraminic acid synthetase